MSPHWTAFMFDVECGTGYGRHRIPALEPVHVVTSVIRRCQLHSSVEVDWPAVDAARLAIDAARAGSAPRTPSPVTRTSPVRQPSSFASLRDTKLPFDPRAAAAGDRRDA